MALSQIESWRAILLAKFGWFSHKYIASRIFAKPLEDVTDRERQEVSKLLFKEKVSVNKARNGLTPEAQKATEFVEKQKSKEKRKRKAG